MDNPQDVQWIENAIWVSMRFKLSKVGFHGIALPIINCIIESRVLSGKTLYNNKCIFYIFTVKEFITICPASGI